MFLIPAHDRPPRQTLRCRRGLSFAELIIGMAVTCLTLAALATFVLAVTAGWKRSGDQFRARNASTIADNQMHDLLAGMLTVAQFKAGGPNGEQAYLFFWKADGITGAADGKAQFGEMALLEYDPATDAVWLYQTKPTASMTAAQRVTASNEAWGDPTAAAIVDYYRSSDIVDARKAIVGGSTSGTAATVSVSTATFDYAASAGGKPTAQFDLTLINGSSQTESYGSVPLRAAQAPTNFN